MIVTKKDANKFSILSKDRNKIHLDKNFSSNFFFKEPIAHGIYLSIIGISEFLKKQSKMIVIKSLKINFKNFLTINEKYYVRLENKKIFIENELNRKIEILIDYEITQKNKFKKDFYSNKYLKFFKIKKLINDRLISQLVFISYYIGSIRPGNGSLLHKMEIKKNENLKKKFYVKTNKKIGQIYHLSLFKDNYKIDVITSKLKPFKRKKTKSLLTKKTLKSIYKKKILLIGKSSDIGTRLINNNIRKNSKLYYLSFRINSNSKNISHKNLLMIKKKLKKVKPDYIFYLSSPRISFGRKSNKYLLNYYKLIYVHYFRKILDFVKNYKIESKVFYPSSLYLDNPSKHKNLECYLIAKSLGEKICNNIYYKKFTFSFRIPQIASRSNYNILGFYEGKDLKIIDKYLNRFFLTKT
mgnify:CR=1 FL=1